MYLDLFPLGFKLKDFLRDDETLSHFLHHNASLPHHALKHIVEADVNLEKVNEDSCLESLLFILKSFFSNIHQWVKCFRAASLTT